MNVNNRKLFANRDARRQLSQMGGIVASSPELLGAAQQFQMGGEARLMNPNDRLNILLNSPYVMQQADILGMTPQDFVGGLSPTRSSQLIEAELANQRDVARMLEEPEVPSVSEGPVPVLEPDALAFVTGPGFAQPDFNTPEEEAANAEARARAEAELAARQAQTLADRAERNAATAEAAGRDDAAELRARADAAAADAAAAAAVIGAEPERPSPVLTPEAPEVLTSPVPTPRPDTEDGAPPEGPTTQDLEDAVNADGDPAQNFSNALGISGSVEERISQYEALFGRMFGQDDEEKNRERWMNMAMIGFAIAAGEDPSALKNIADGLLQGAQVSREDMATRRQRRDRIQELAVAAGLEDERLAQRIAAQGGSGGTRFSPTEPYVDAVTAVATAALQRGEYGSIQEAMDAASASLYPYYFGTAGGAAGSELDLAAMQAAEDAARAAGETEFSFGGMRYPVR